MVRWTRVVAGETRLAALFNFRAVIAQARENLEFIGAKPQAPDTREIGCKLRT
jgi:hypothetical protein